MLRGQHETDSSRREVIERAPYARINEQALIRMVQQYRLTLEAIVERHMERATDSNDKLAEPLMGMSTTGTAPRDIIHPIGAFDFEGDDVQTLSNGQVTTRVCNLGKVKYLNL